jgi:hypothetical protein
MAIMVPVLGSVLEVERRPETARPLVRARRMMVILAIFLRIFISSISPNCELVALSYLLLK